MNDTQLAKMSYQELLETRSKIDSTLVKRRAEERRDVKAKIAALAESSGFDIGELMGGKAKGSKLAGKKALQSSPIRKIQARLGQGAEDSLSGSQQSSRRARSLRASRCNNLLIEDMRKGHASRGFFFSSPPAKHSKR